MEEAMNLLTGIDPSALVLDSFVPPSPPHKTSKSSSSSENRLDQSEFPIPDHISDAELEEFFVALKSNLEKYHYTSSLNLAERTIAFARTDKDADTLKPGPGPDGKFLSKEFFFDKKRATKLKEVWPSVELLLTERGVSATLNLDECQVEIATSALIKDPEMIDKARNLLILLTRSLIPPNMALEIFQGSRAYTTIEIGDQENGLCTTFGIEKKEYCIRWECLSCSIEALSKARRCHLFLNENTLTAVTAGKNSTLDGLRDDVKKCITTNLCLVDKFVDNVDFESLNCIGDSKDPHYKHYKVSSGYMLECDDDIMPVVCCLYAPICENLVTKLKEALPMLTSMLTGYGASCTLAKDCMTLSSIERPQDPDIIDKEWQVLELLSTTHVPVSMASEIMSGNLQSGVFKIGNQEGGLCSLYGINKEDYLKQWNCLRYSLEALADEAVCNIFLNENTVAAVGGSSAIGIVQAFIDDCILNNACPATAARNYKILSQGLDSIEDPHVKHMEMENPGSLSDMPEVTSYCMAFDIEQASEVSKHWEALKMFFNKYNISCQLFFEAAQYMYIHS